MKVASFNCGFITRHGNKSSLMYAMFLLCCVFLYQAIGCTQKDEDKDIKK